MENFYAHTDPENPEDLTKWEPLFSEDCEALNGPGHRCEKCEGLDRFHGHLNKVAWWAGKFAKEMFPPGSEEGKAAKEWGYLAGLWHDLGKFAPEWQAYLRTKADPHLAEVNETIDHATAGAQHAVSEGSPLSHFLAYSISGHHSGLLDAISGNASLEKRLRKDIRDYSKAPPEILDRSISAPPAGITDPAFFTRMLFSCLVDADFLATEAFMNPNQANLRCKVDRGVLGEMQMLLDATIAGFGEPDSPVDVARAGVHSDCRNAATRAPGLFSLTVPTGGGKTLASLSFALRHARAHNLQRVIYVIPFTSIIDQNAKVFEEIFAPLAGEDGSPIVLQHHSNLSPEKETEQSRLATENWDAPLVVTTAVQFYESLYGDRTSKCRKLHRIANSVVILDEAQCLPVEFLKPCLNALRELSTAYGTSTVLCTATQPAVHRTEKFPPGLENIREIISDPVSLYKSLRRVSVVDRGKMDDTQLTGELAEREQVLAIVNTRKHAQTLFQLLPENEANRHLSALMCPAHRQRVLEEVRERLESEMPVRLISTQLIEAGVDVDFPTVYRSLAGMDSIAQAAGRCNRNGKNKFGETFVFRSEHQRAEAYFRDTAQIADRLLKLYEDDPLGLESVEKFFSLYYLGHTPVNGNPWDTEMIMDDFKISKDRKLPFHFQFREASRKFRLIKNNQIPILIEYDDEAKRLLDELRNESIPLHRDLLRGLQPYTVQIYERDFRKNSAQFETLRDGQFHILICPETHYSNNFGIHLNDETVNSGLLICDQ